MNLHVLPLLELRSISQVSTMSIVGLHTARPASHASAKVLLCDQGASSNLGGSCRHCFRSWPSSTVPWTCLITDGQAFVLELVACRLVAGRGWQRITLQQWATILFLWFLVNVFCIVVWHVQWLEGGDTSPDIYTSFSFHPNLAPVCLKKVKKRTRQSKRRTCASLLRKQDIKVIKANILRADFGSMCGSSSSSARASNSSSTH